MTLSRSKLFERRKTLEGSIPVRLAERRFEPRLVVGDDEAPFCSKRGALLNLSDSGFAVEVPRHCRFARGESHRIDLRVGAGKVEVDGSVRWTKSTWQEGESQGRGAYKQAAGFEILESVNQETHSILEILRTMMQTSKVTVEVSGSRVLNSLTKL